MRVLIADDQPVNRRLFVLLAEKIGVEVIEAEDGSEALEKAALNPDIIFLDIAMPRMNGREAAAELRRRGFTKPVIALTAGVCGDDEARCREAGFDDILWKPFTKRELEIKFCTWVNSAAAAETIPGAGLGVKNSSPANNAAASAAAYSAAARGSLPGGETSICVFDREELLNTFINNAGNAKALLAHFLERCTLQVEALAVYAEDRNWTEAFRITHSIKGSARMLSGAELGNRAALLEKACQQVGTSTDAAAIENLLPVLVESFTRFKNAAEEFIQS